MGSKKPEGPPLCPCCKKQASECPCGNKPTPPPPPPRKHDHACCSSPKTLAQMVDRIYYESEITKLRSANDRYRKALEDIIKHQECISTDFSKRSVAWLIATNALQDATKGEAR